MPSSVPLSISVICLPTEHLPIPLLLNDAQYQYIVALNSAGASPDLRPCGMCEMSERIGRADLWSGQARLSGRNARSSRLRPAGGHGGDSEFGEEAIELPHRSAHRSGPMTGRRRGDWFLWAHRSDD